MVFPWTIEWILEWTIPTLVHQTYSIIFFWWMYGLPANETEPEVDQWCFLFHLSYMTHVSFHVNIRSSNEALLFHDSNKKQMFKRWGLFSSHRIWGTLLLSFYVISRLCRCDRMVSSDARNLSARSWKVSLGFCLISSSSWNLSRVDGGIVVSGSRLQTKIDWTTFERFVRLPNSLQTRRIFF